MILAIGLVVDDAIIVVERVQYLMLTQKADSHKAALIAMQQIGSAVLATTFVLLAILCFSKPKSEHITTSTQG